MTGILIKLKCFKTYFKSYEKRSESSQSKLTFPKHIWKRLYINRETMADVSSVVIIELLSSGTLTNHGSKSCEGN